MLFQHSYLGAVPLTPTTVDMDIYLAAVWEDLFDDLS